MKIYPTTDKNLKDSNGRYRSRSLFVELIESDYSEKGIKPLFTIREEDKKIGKTVYPSMYRLFMECADEFEFAEKYLSISHWNRLIRPDWFTKGISMHRGLYEWREDIRKRDESIAKRILISAVKKGDIAAAKKLYDISCIKTTKRGRFIKEEAIKESKIIAKEKSSTSQDALRMNIVKIR